MALQDLLHLVEMVPKPRLLLVDDEEPVRTSLSKLLSSSGFDVISADSVKTAIALITSHTFDVLLTDLHMPKHGDGLTVVSAMRNAHPKATTLIFSGYPAMHEAASAISLQADGVLVKPMDPKKLVQEIFARLDKGAPTSRAVEDLASILESCTQETIAAWLARVDADAEIITVKLNHADRCAHLPELFRDLVFRLRFPLPLGNRALISPAAAAHGRVRRGQGYTAAMLVEESRMLQVSIFQTLQNNLYRVNFSLLLVGVMAIADEVDSQLAQAMASYVDQSLRDALPVVA